MTLDSVSLGLPRGKLGNSETSSAILFLAIASLRVETYQKLSKPIRMYQSLYPPTLLSSKIREPSISIGLARAEKVISVREITFYEKIGEHRDAHCLS